MQKLRIAALALALGGFAAGAGAQTVVNTDIEADTTWSGVIVLDGPIYVRGATLTILPGTIVRGQPRTAAVSGASTAGSPGTLIVTQSGRIVANGTALAPIIMTTAATDNNNDGIPDNVAPADTFLDPWEPLDTFYDDTPATAPLAPLDKAGVGNVRLWGGLVILGNAPTNLANGFAGVPYGQGVVEGLVLPATPVVDAQYGGSEPHDNSGSLKFVSVRHAGDELLGNNELNGITLAGVGDGTVIQNVEVYLNFDDGLECFGGTVNLQNAGVFFVGDDSFDVDQGYTGVMQFLFTIQPFFNQAGPIPAFGSASGDKMAELDGDDFAPDAPAVQENVNLRVNYANSVFDDTVWPLSAANLYNLTGIGSTPDVANPVLPLGITPAAANLGVQMRNGFAGNLFSSIVVNTGSQKGIALVAGGGTPGNNVSDNVAAGLIAVNCSTFQNTGAIVNPSLDQDAINNGDGLYATPADNNVVNLGTFTGLQNESTYFDPTGNAAGKLDATLKPVPINPRPNVGLAGVVGCVPPQGPGLTGVTYRGAFSRLAPVLWTTDWTALNIGGILAD